MHVGNVKVQARVVRALTNLSVHESNKPKIATVCIYEKVYVYKSI